MDLAKYRKTIASIVTGLLGWGAVVVASEMTKISAPEWLFLGTVIATSVGVYSVKNAPMN